MSILRDTRDEKILKLLLRTQINFKQRKERINWEYDVFYPLIERYKAGKPVLGLKPGETITDIDLTYEDPHSDDTTTALGAGSDAADAARPSDDPKPPDAGA